MKMMHKLAIASVLMMIVTAPVQGTADSTAVLVASRGDVMAEKSGESRSLVRGDGVNESDRVITGDKSFAILQFVDGAKVTVRPNTVLDIKQYVYSGTEGNAATLSLVEGGLRVITGAMAKTEPESFKVETPVALMGVRGTEFAVVLCDDGTVCQEEGLEME
jgi:hypothetical protein